MKRALLVLAVALGVALGTTSPAAWGATRPPAVTPWIEFELDVIASHRMNPARASRALALASRAMFKAALLRRQKRDAAVVGAASTVLAYLFPDEAARIDELLEEVMPIGASDKAERKGFRRGQRIGRKIIARAETDGSAAVWQGVAPVGPGFWEPTPPGFVYPPLEPLAGTWRTWNVGTGSEFRPPPPPAVGSARFLLELREVYEVSQALTAQQKRVADYWGDGPGTVTPPGHWNVIALDLVRAANLSTRVSTRVFATLNTAQADAFVTCWDAKYAYWSPRPVTAIRMLIDSSWLSYITTPPFPSYVSGHSTTSGAASTVLAAFFPARAAALAGMAEEAAVSRLYGGIHFRSENDVGLALGRRVGAAALAAYAPRLEPGEVQAGGRQGET